MLIDCNRDLIHRKTLELLYYSIEINLENITFENYYKNDTRSFSALRSLQKRWCGEKTGKSAYCILGQGV